MDQKVLRKKLFRLRYLRKSIDKNRLEEFNLHWFTPQRLRRIQITLADIEELEEMGFRTIRTKELKKILQMALLAWGIDDIKNPPGELKKLWFKLTKQKKVRKEIVEKYQKQVALHDVRYVNLTLNRVIAQIGMVIHKESLVQYKTDILEYEPHLERSKFMVKLGIPKLPISRQREYITLHWKQIEKAANEESSNKNKKMIFLLRSLASFAGNIPEKVFIKKFEEILLMLSLAYSQSKEKEIPFNAINIPRRQQ